MKEKDGIQKNFTNNKRNNKSNTVKIIIPVIILIGIVIFAILMSKLFNIEKNTYTVTFETNTSSSLEAIKVNENDTIAKPENPTKEGYTFAGWYYNNELYNFEQGVTSDIKLEARWLETEKVSGVELDKAQLVLYLNQTSTLTAKIMPENAKNKSVIWNSSDSNIVSVDSYGNIKALKNGNATITVTTQDGRYTATAQISVISEKEENSDYSTLEKIESSTTTKNIYEVMFKDANGEILSKTQKVEDGNKAKKPETPTKTGYTFLGWYNGAIKYTFKEQVKENITLTARWVKNKYAIVFINYDYTILETKVVEHGEIPVYTKELPTRPADNVGTYTFSTWNKEIKAATQNTIYKATYTVKLNKFKVTFEDEDGTKLADTQIVEYGSKATEPEAPTKEWYTFEGWYNGDKKYTFTEKVKEDITLTAKWAKNKYKITFKNYDGTVLESKKVEYGELPTYTGETPIKPADEQYTYTFTGWTPEIVVAEKAATYTATYTSKIRSYEVMFKDEDGTTLAETQIIEYGSKATEPEAPTKKGHTFEYWCNGENRYTFEEEVKGNVTLTAKWTKIKYTIRFVNFDGVILETKKVPFGELPTYTTPTKPENVQYSYVFAGWNPNLKEVEQDAIYTAIYEEVVNKYEVTFKDEDGTTLAETQKVEYGSKATEPAQPIKVGYTFLGWYNGETKYDFTEEIKGKVELTAKWEINKYTITFVNYEGTVLETQILEHGTIPTYTKQTPTKPADQTYTYSFNGWDKELTEATSDTTYTATYTATYIEYAIKFVNEDGTEISNKTYHFGDIVEQPAAPTKPANAQYTYTFAGWTPNVTVVEKDATYTATYTAVVNKYEVTFKDEDGTKLAETQKVEYGSKATEPTKPTRTGYTFQGWYNGNTKYNFTEQVKENVELVAKWKINKYTITFVNEDGTVLETKVLEYGTMPTYTKETPTKPANAQYTYTFAGWTPNVTVVEKDTTYTATYTAVVNKYEVTFKDEDGTKLAETQKVEYGSKATEPTKPTKVGYTFQGWYNGDTKYDFEEQIKEKVELTAKWKINKYTITFVNYEGTVLETQKVEHGKMPTYTKETPTKPADQTYTYSFNGWDKELTEATSDTTYTATYTATYIEYVIKFVNEDGAEISNKTYHFGDIVEQPAAPTKPANAQYTYTFAGWTPNVTVVEKDATYTAVYTSTIRSYEVTFKDEDGTKLAETQKVEYGSKATEPTKPTRTGYTFQGWYNGNTKYNFTEQVKENVELVAKWKINKYTITFVNDEGTVLETQTVEHGKMPIYTKGTPTKNADAQYTYTFKEWNPSVVVAEKDATYTAVYISTIRTYEVTFKDEDGTKLAETQKVKYGEKATEPAKPSSKEGYEFQGWYNGDTKYNFTEAVKGNVDLVAKWAKTKYTITFVNYDDKVLDTQMVEHGAIPAYTKETPTKPADNTYSYSFTGWSPTIAAATKDATYKAQFKSFIDVDSKINNAIAGVKDDRFEVKPLQGDNINVKFNGHYDLVDLVSGVISLLDKLSSDPSYESFNISYNGQTVDLTDYDFSDTSNLSSFMGLANWLMHLCGKSNLWQLIDATTNDLVGKTVEITVNLNGDNVLEDGSKTAKYYLSFSY